MLTKLQIAFCVLAGLGIVVFGAGMFSNVNVAKVPGWLAPLAWGSFGLVLASCAGVVVTLALDREKEPGSEEDEEEEEEHAELEEPAGEEATIGSVADAKDLGVVHSEEHSEEHVEEHGEEHGAVHSEEHCEEPLAEHPDASGLTTVEDTEFQESEAEPMQFAEPGSEETIEFSSLPSDDPTE